MNNKMKIGAMAIAMVVPAIVVPVQAAVQSETEVTQNELTAEKSVVVGTTPMVAGDTIKFADKLWDVYNVTAQGQAQLMSQEFLPKHEKTWRSNEFVGILNNKINTFIPNQTDRVKLISRPITRENYSGGMPSQNGVLGMMNKSEWEKYKQHITPSDVSDTAIFHYMTIGRSNGAIKEDVYSYVTPEGEYVQNFSSQAADEKYKRSYASLVRPTIQFSKDDSHKTSDGSQSKVVLSAPTTLTAENIEQTTITLNWDKVESAEGYILKRDGKVVYKGPRLTFDDTLLVADTDYQYDVFTYYGSISESDTKASLLVSTLTDVPEIPETPDAPDWSFDNPTGDHKQGVPTVTVIPNKPIKDIKLKKFNWVTKPTTVSTSHGDIVLKPDGNGNILISAPNGLTLDNQSTTIEVEHEGVNFLDILIKTVPELDFSFNF